VRLLVSEKYGFSNSVTKANILMLCKAQFAVCSEIHTKHTNSVRSKCRIVECYALVYEKLQAGSKSLRDITNECFQISVVLQVILSLSENVTRRMWLLSCRRFGTTNRSHRQESVIPRLRRSQTQTLFETH
jgi:hypothetical protein